jgi:SAM-dependent methyltransferase
MTSPSFEELIDEGERAPIDGWDFSWFEGRATEERPDWGYANLLSEHMERATSALDIETGGGEVLGAIRHAPPVLKATESWEPNLLLARERLRRVGAYVVQVDQDAPLPFEDASFDLVASRHPTTVNWGEIARVLHPGGTYLAQLIGHGTNRELFEYLMGPQQLGDAGTAQNYADGALEAGLMVRDLREQATRVEFFDVAAVIHFLRKVIWTVPDFSVEKYHDRLADLHRQIERDGSFVSCSQRVLIEAVKPPVAATTR